MLFAEGQRAYLEGLRVKEYSAETVRAYERDLQLFSCFMEYSTEKRTEIDKVQLEDLERYMCFLKEERALKPRSRNRYASSLSAFFTYAVRRGWVDRNPAVWLDAAKVNRRPMPVCSEEELQELIDAIDHPIIQTAVLVMSKTGLRCGEITSLKREEIDSTIGRIHVVDGKGGKCRAVPIAASLQPALHRYEKEIRKSDSDYYFATQKTGRLSSQYINYILRRVTNKLGWTKTITNHTLRRSFATNLYKRGVGLETIKTLLGHESLRTTSLYLQLQDNDLRDAVNLL